MKKNNRNINTLAYKQMHMKLKDGPLKQQIESDVRKYNEMPEWLRVYRKKNTS